MTIVLPPNVSLSSKVRVSVTDKDENPDRQIGGRKFDTASARAIPPAPNSKPAATTILRISHQIGFMGRAPKSYQEHLPRSLSTRHYKLNTSLASFSQTPPRTEGHRALSQLSQSARQFPRA